MEELRTCEKCLKTLALNNENFKAFTRNKSKFSYKCRNCINEEKREHYSKNREVLVEKHKEYRKRNPEKIKECCNRYYQEHKEEIKANRIKNKERIREVGRQRYKNNPAKDNMACHARKAKIKSLDHTLTQTEWQICKASFDNKCCYCGEEKPLEQEHFIPLKKGGEYTHNNILPSCRSCNSSKKDKDFFEWYPTKSFYSEKRQTKILKYLNYLNQSIQQLRFSIG